MNSIDHLTAAVWRALDPEPGKSAEDMVADYYFRNMDADAKLRFDGLLLRTNDPLAAEAGPPARRFVKRVMRMVELRREHECRLVRELGP